MPIDRDPLQMSPGEMRRVGSATADAVGDLLFGVREKSGGRQCQAAQMRSLLEGAPPEEPEAASHRAVMWA